MSNNSHSQGGSGSQRRTSGGGGNNNPSLSGGSRSDLPYSQPPYIPGAAGHQIHRRSSYASVAAGEANRMPYSTTPGNNPPPSHLPGPFIPTNRSSHTATPSSSFPPQNPNLIEQSRRMTMDFDPTHTSTIGSRVRSGTVPGHSSSSMFGSMSVSHMDNALSRQEAVPDLFIPSYLVATRYSERLAQRHKNLLAASTRNGGPASSTSGSLSTSASSANIHTFGHSHSHSHPHISTQRLVPSYRGMTHDIIEHPPRPVYLANPPASTEDAPQPLPSKWNESDKHAALELSADGREARILTSIRRGAEEAGLVRADHPIPLQAGIYYFEIEIHGITRGAPVGSTIGIGFQGKDCVLNRLPGWEPNSWGYHGDDGQIYQVRAEGKPYGPKYGKGDVVGCGINFKTRTAFFTRNGVRFPTAFKDIKGDVYPVVGLKSQNESIKVNFGQDPFDFDIDGMLADEKFNIMREVNETDSTQLSPPLSEKQLIHELITQYLQHDGYTETLEALLEELDTENEALGADPYGISEGPSLRQINAEDSQDALIRQSESQGDLIKRTCINVLQGYGRQYSKVTLIPASP